MENRPRGREQHVTGQGKPVAKRGEGLGTGPVGNGGGYNGRGGNSNGPKKSSGPNRSGGSKLLYIIIAIVVLLGGGGAGLGNLLGGSDVTDSSTAYDTSSTSGQTSTTSSSSSGSSSGSSSSSSSSSGSSVSSLFGLPSGFTQANTSSGWTLTSNSGKLNQDVDASARAKYTNIKGSGKDLVTIMVYMCGADLESKSGMATADLLEMCKATLSDNVRIIVYTGGAKKWNNQVISSQKNQIYKIQDGGLVCLEKDMGFDAMTKPATLTTFIKYCTKNYPADRNALIFWDHGGGSLSGYGYDEAHSGSGSMTLKGIDEALSNSGATFDFIGFDACLMATVENALMLSKYADYLVASEELEPGVGWYYTNWLTALSKNTSMATVEIGKNIADDFVSVCGQKCSGQKTTLSVVDLAELSATVPDDFSAFASSTLELVESNDYQVVADARSQAREFSQSSKIDQVDLVSLASKIGTEEANALTDSILGAVKYNKTSSGMTDAYGLSIYFPYNKVSKVQNAVSTYEAIGIDSSYSACIQKFASLETCGQAVSGGTTSPLNSLLSGYSTSDSTSSVQGTDAITQIISGLLGGDASGIMGLSGDSLSFLGRSMDEEADVAYLADHQFDAGQLVWTEDGDRDPVMYLSEDQWSMVHDLELNVFVDDGEGYIDLGLDNVYDFTENGGLVGVYKGTGLAINQQPVAYYHMDTVDDGDNYTITGYVPVYVNDVRSKLILVFDNENPYGYIAGVETVYDESEVEVAGKNLSRLEEGDVLDFICDYYSYDGEYQDSYYLGDQMIVEGDLEISDVSIIGESVSAVYRFTDMYNQNYWTPVMK